MKKKTVVITASLIAVLIGVALAYLYQWQNQMEITQSKYVQVEKPLGTKITTFNWGDFNGVNYTKTETFWLRSLTNAIGGNTTFNVTYTVYNLPSAFSFSIDKTIFTFTSWNQTIMFHATLTLQDMTAQPQTFTFQVDFHEP